MPQKPGILIGAIAVAVIAIAVWLIVKPSHEHTASSIAAARQVDLDALTRMREAIPKVEFGSELSANTAEAERVFTEAIARANGGDSVVPEAARRALAAELAAEVGARSTGDAEDYVRLVLARSPRWITPGEERPWTIVQTFVEERFPNGIDPSRPEAALRTVMQDAMTEQGFTLKAIGAGPSGCDVVFARVRTRDGIENALWMGEDAHTYWMSGPTITTIRLWRPAVSLDDVLRRDKVATVARVCFVARNAVNTTPAIVSLWYYDPQTGKWHCDMLQNRGRSWHATVF